MSATITLVIVVPDSVDSVNSAIMPVEVSDNMVDQESIDRIARYITSIANSSQNVTSIDLDVA